MRGLLTSAEIRDRLSARGLRPSRALGQHFLADPNTARRIVGLAGVEPGDRVVEVGPGVGSLTLALAAAGARVTALELDRHLLPVLGEVVAGLDVRVVRGDALTVDWDGLLDGGSWAMVANLPYNVATPVLARALEAAPAVRRFLVMVQREVGERLAAGPGSKTYGAVSVKVAYYASATVVGRVPPTVFVPPPRVESVLVQLVRRERPPVEVRDPARMLELVRAGFATRRKTLRRALRVALGDDADAVLRRAGIDPGAGAVTLDLAAWAALERAAAEAGP